MKSAYHKLFFTLLASAGFAAQGKNLQRRLPSTQSRDGKNPKGISSCRNLLNLVVIVALAGGLGCGQAIAQQTTAFTYQGQLRDGGTNANGTYTMTFKLYDAVSIGNQIGSAITNSPTLANGLFTVNLDFGAGAFNGSTRWLEINVAGDTLTPRIQVLPTPYAIYATTAGSAGAAGFATTAGSSTTANSATNAGTATLANSVATNSITTASLQNNAVTTAKISDGSVTTAKIADSAVTNPKLAANVVATANIQNSAVTTAQINDSAVTTPKIADGAVTDAKIVSVNGSKVSGAVALATFATSAGSATTAGSAMTADSATLANSVAANSVATTNIQEGAVTDAKISTNSALIRSVETNLVIIRGDISSAGGINTGQGFSVATTCCGTANDRLTFNVAFAIPFSATTVVTLGVHSSSGKATIGLASVGVNGFTAINNFGPNGGAPSGFSFIAIGTK